jgi:hypothetical protein
MKYSGSALMTEFTIIFLPAVDRYNLIGKLIYLIITRLDILFVVSQDL